MGRDILCLKSLTQALILNLALRSFLWHWLPHVENSDKHFAEEAKLRRTSEWSQLQKAVGFNHVAASPWSCRLLSALQSSAPPRWLSQPSLWTSPSEVYYLPVPLNVICFVPAKGIKPSTLGLDLSLCVRLSKFQLLCIMSSESSGWLVYVSFG